MTRGNLVTLLLLCLIPLACTPTTGSPGVTASRAETEPEIEPDAETETETETETTALDLDSPLVQDAQMYASEVGISLEEAVRRFEFQDSIGDIQPALMSDLATTFGGLWVEHQPEFGIFIALTDGDESALRPYIEGKPWYSYVEVRQVEYTLVELLAAQQIASGMAATVNSAVTASVDVINNQVQLTVGNPEIFLADLASAGKHLPGSVVVLPIQPDLPLPESNQGSVLEAISEDGSTIFLPKQPPSGFSMAALMEGTLVEVNGCLRVTGDGYEDGFLLLWPNDSDMRLSGQAVEVLNGDMKVVAQVGESLRIGGGAIESPNGMAGYDELIPGLPLPGCPGPYWVAAPLETVAEQAMPDVYVDPFSSGGRILALFIQQSRPSDVEGTLTGKLVVDEDGCMRVADHTILWPPGIFPREEPLRLVSTGEAPLADVGDMVTISGAVKQAGDYRYFENKVPCPAPFWGANEFVLAD